MAPLIEDSDFSLYVDDDDVVFSVDTYNDDNKTVPLHEQTTTTATTNAAAPILKRHNKRPRRCRNVSFGALAELFEIPNRHEYTPEERAATWLDANDMRRMKQAARADAKRFETTTAENGEKTFRENDEEEEFTSRGLESRTRSGILRKRRNRSAAYAAVFCEIDLQDDRGFRDDDLIADAYFVYSEHCAVQAQMLGDRDAVDAASERERR